MYAQHPTSGGEARRASVSIFRSGILLQKAEVTALLCKSVSADCNSAFVLVLVTFVSPSKKSSGSDELRSLTPMRWLWASAPREVCTRLCVQPTDQEQQALLLLGNGHISRARSPGHRLRHKNVGHAVCLKYLNLWPF